MAILCMDDSSKLLRSYVRTLADNADSTRIPKEVDIVFSGGAFNGFMGYGVMLYIKALFVKHGVMVHRVSGCSIGSLLAAFVFADADYQVDKAFRDSVSEFKRTLRLKPYGTQVDRLTNSISDEDFARLNKRLHITYYDLKKREQKVVNRFRSREHLAECIKRSSHIPCITTEETRYKGRYMDGIIPHIFQDGARPTLYIDLLPRSKLFRVLNVRGETNPHSRILTGIAEADSFFTHGKSAMCSYVSSWSAAGIAQVRLSELISFIIVALVEITGQIYSYIPQPILDNVLSQGLHRCIASVYGDVMYRLIV